MRALAALCLLLPTAAIADAPKALRPLRDVDITYHMSAPGGGQVLTQRLRWSAATQRQRVDLPVPGNWMVLDFTTHRMTLVQDQRREVLDMPAPPGAEQQPGQAAFARIGAGRVAGLACTVWRTQDTRGQQMQACYTDDGVLLRASAGSQVLMEAVTVTFAPQDANVFAPPDGYTHQPAR